MNRATAKRLLDAHNACLEIAGFTTGKSLTDMWNDRGLQLVLQKLIEIVGEALNQASRTDDTLATSIPELRRFVNIRNRITHGYDSVDYAIIWEVSTTHVPALVPILESLLQSAPDS